MKHHVLGIFGILLAGCATRPENIPPVTGPHALSVLGSDARQIQQLVAARADIGGTVRIIEAVGRNRVRVEAGRDMSSTWSGGVFFAVRQYGTWRIDEQTPFERVTEPKVRVLTWHQKT